MATLEKWLEVLHQEYLKEYLEAGGSAIKFISGSDKQLESIRNSLCQLSQDEGCFFASLDPSKLDEIGKKPDLHRIDKFFFAATKNVAWKSWAEQQARKFLDNHGIKVEPGRELKDIDGIASDNGRIASDLIREYQGEFATPILKNPKMAIEFRAAIVALGRVQIMPDTITPTTEEVLLEWFAGRAVKGGAVALKKIQIFERILVSNARSIFASFCRWLPEVGYSGMVVVLDFRPYEYKRIPKTRRMKETLERIRTARDSKASSEEIDRIMREGEYEPEIIYSDNAYMQMLELLRHFIDEISRFERLLLVVLTTRSFYDENSPRKYFDYDALQTRIGLEVKDAKRDNPAAALVHLGEK